jgi:hypothetical protein
VIDSETDPDAPAGPAPAKPLLRNHLSLTRL